MICITGNNEPKLKADNGLLRRGLLIETKNKFYPLEKYNNLPINLQQNAKIANPDLVNDLDNIEDKIAWIQLHLKYAIEMYTNNAIHVNTLQNNFQQYCLERDNWVLLIGDRLEITDNEDDRITRNELSTLYNDIYHAEVSDDTAREEGKRIGLIYKQSYRKGLERGAFVKVRIIPPITFGDIMNNITQA